MRIRGSWAVGGVMAMALVVAGCGGDDDDESAGDDWAFTVTATDSACTLLHSGQSQYDPGSHNVRFVNETELGVSIVMHVDEEGGSVAAETGTEALEPGDTITVQGDFEAGEYVGVCNSGESIWWSNGGGRAPNDNAPLENPNIVIGD